MKTTQPHRGFCFLASDGLAVSPRRGEFARRPHPTYSRVTSTAPGLFYGGASPVLAEVEYGPGDVVAQGRTSVDVRQFRVVRLAEITTATLARAARVAADSVAHLGDGTADEGDPVHAVCGGERADAARRCANSAEGWARWMERCASEGRTVAHIALCGDLAFECARLARHWAGMEGGEPGDGLHEIIAAVWPTPATAGSAS